MAEKIIKGEPDEPTTNQTDTIQPIVVNPTWAHRPQDKPSTTIVPPNKDASKQAEEDEPSGLENVSVDKEVSTKPANWREAVKDNFTAKDWEDNPHTPKYGNMQDVIDYLERARAAIHIPTKEELEKERRRRRTEGIIASIADGASAISNLITTTQYAPDMYDGNNTMTRKMKERYDRLKAEREADADKYFNYSLTLAKFKEGQDDKEYKRGRDALQDQIAQSKAENAAKLADIKYRRTLQQISDAEAAAEEKKANAELDRQIKEARRDWLRSQARKNDRWVPSAGRRSSGGGGGGGSKGRHPWRDDKGVFGKPGAVIYETSESGAREMASMHDGTYLTTGSRSESTSIGKDVFGQEKKTTTTTVRNTSTPGGKAKPAISQDNTPPSRRNKQ